MIDLFISTATNRLIFAIIKNNDILYLYNEIEKEGISEKFMDIIEKSFIENNIDKKNINSVYVVNGPGSFTGIRVGLTFSKTLAWCLKTRIIPISTLEMLASTHVDTEYIMPLIDARRDYIYFGLYDKNLNSIVKDKYVSIEEVKKYSNYTIVSDDEFEKSIKPNIDILKIIDKHKNDISNNIHSLNPNYLKNTEAEEKYLKND